MSSVNFAAPSARATSPVVARQIGAWASRDSPSLVLMLGETERRIRFGFALQQALDRQGLSERELAKRLGVDARKVASWRKGKTLPDLYMTIALARELRVKESLFRDPPAVPPRPHYPIEDYLLGAVDAGTERGLTDGLPPDEDGPAPGGRPRRRRPPRPE